ncbi:MAG TPA: isoamylase [Gemmataceae bacterium]|nr:isoamylase [Gemmataceae bacterium]
MNALTLKPGSAARLVRNRTPRSAWFTTEGSPLPLGQSWVEAEQAYNFSLFAENASGVTLLLYDEQDTTTPCFTLALDPLVNKLRELWFCRVPKASVPGARFYAYSVRGPAPGGPEFPSAFDPDKVLLDPYARAVHFPPGFDRDAARRPGPNAGKAPLGVLSGPQPPFDWGADRRSRHGPDAVVYELHVRGFTNDPGSGVAATERGTFAGVVAKIPYLKELGVTAVELMPIQQFDPQEGNYWGYMTLNFFAPHAQYATDPERARGEFRELVKALHAADIEVILDVVYNHTAEGNQNGPTYSFKGIDAANYYLLTGDPADPFRNYAGTGNTFHCANRAAGTLIVESLRYWVSEMHVDGFRFDLASILARGPDGSPVSSDSPLLTVIRADPVLRNVRLIAEPWDAGGLYQLGSHFPGHLFHQWNGRFRDDVRRFVRGDAGMVPSLMCRLYGSDDLFPDTPREACRPFHGINYIASHDGFTLYDLVGYNERRNQANGHANTDGPRDNFSWNCGWEGDDGVPPEVLTLRKRQAKNLFCLLMLANGIPMFRAGDEFLQTQGGNNNPYNQDNETSWLDWDRLRTHADVFRFCKLMIAFRKAHPAICRSRYWRDDVRWYGVGPAADLSPDSHSLAYSLHGGAVGGCDLYVMINGYSEPLRFRIQEGPAGGWRRAIDTGRESPGDITESGADEVIPGTEYEVRSRSVVVLIREALA